MSEWLSLADTIPISESAGPLSLRKKVLSANVTSIAESPGYRYSKSFQDTLYRIFIETEDGNGIIPSEHAHTELPEHFPEPNNISLISGIYNKLV